MTSNRQHRDGAWQTGKPGKGRLLGLAGIAVAVPLILACCIWAANGRAEALDQDMRNRMLGQAVALARTINPQRVKALSFTPADQDNLSFQELSQQLASYCQVVSCRGIWSLALRDGALVTGPESYAPADPFSSPPGTVYQGASPELRNLFQSGAAFVRGPYTDEYGDFVTAFAPVVDPRSGEVLMVAGVDVETTPWLAALTRERLATAAGLLVLAVMLLAGPALLGYRSRLPAERRGWLRHTEVYWVAAFGVAMTALGSLGLRDNELRSRQAIFSQLAGSQADLTREKLRDLRQNILADTVRFFEGSSQVERSEFRVFVSPDDLPTGVQALGWAPAVTATGLSALAAQAQAEGLAGFSVWQAGASGRPEPAAGRPVYYPLWFVEPLAGHRSALGYDLGSHPVQRASLETAMKTGLAEATGVITPALGTAKQPGVLVCEAVFSGAGEVAGFVVMLVDPESLLQPAQATRSAADALTGTSLYQLASGQDPVLLASLAAQPGAPQQTGGLVLPTGNQDLAAVYPILAFGQAYALVVVPGTAFPAGAWLLSERIVGAIGLLLTAALAALTAFLVRRRADLETRVQERTAQLQASQERFKQMAELLPLAIIESDAAGWVTYANRHTYEQFGFAEGDVARGVHLDELVTPEFRDRLTEITGQRITGSPVEPVEYVALRKDGSTFHALGHAAPVLAGGQIAGMRGFVLDISSRKRAEEVLRQANRKLEQAMAQAELATRAKSEFLANMSHEIRTPMNGVIGMTGLLLDTDLSPEQRQYAQIVHTSGEALLSLINDILDFSKIEARKVDLEMLDFDLRATLEDAAEMLAVKAQEKGLDLACIIAPDVPALLRGDPGRLRQVIVNLAGNAVKFTHHGGVTIRAGLVAEDRHQVTVHIAVADTGIGIPRDRQAGLFTPFTQVDGATSRKYGGTGLGLAISRQLVELMGGQIGLHSEPGRGSTFWFTAVFDKQPPSPAAALPAPADLGGARVLVVDDYPANRLLVTTLLKQWGCRFAEAAAGEATLAQLREAAARGDPFDIALLDSQLPDMDGPALGRAIKGSPELSGTPLVMMTSLAERGEARQLAELGFAGYLTKPLRQSHLRDCLALVLGRAQAPAAAPPVLVTRHTVAETRKRRIRILVAEDNVTNQVVALKLLERLGYHADAVADGQEAVDALRDIPYDVILMDCQMPEMDGFEATRRIRDPQTPVLNHRAHIVALTANAMQGDREKCLAAGMDDYLSKPIQPAALAAALERWLDSHPDLPLPADAPARPVVFDRTAFPERLLGNTEVGRVIIRQFLAGLPDDITQLAATLDAGDTRLAMQQAHNVKGAAALVGGEALREAAQAVEQAARGGALDVARARLPELEQQAAELMAVLKAL